MRVVVTGASGQVGGALMRAFAARPDDEAVAADRAKIDLGDWPVVRGWLRDLRPTVVFNPAAYTNVDGSETEPDAAYRANTLGAHYLALACAEIGATLVHVSTNMVFDGHKGSAYDEWDAPHPQGVYATSKHAGELYVAAHLRQHYIVRTAWVFGTKGTGGSDSNFVTKMIAAGDARGALSVVDDEIGNPTYAPDLADGLIRLAETGAYGTYHLTNAGATSRYDFAAEIMRLSGRAERVKLTPMKLADFRRAAPTPPNTALNNRAAANLGIVLRDWHDALGEYIRERGLSTTKNHEGPQR